MTKAWANGKHLNLKVYKRIKPRRKTRKKTMKQIMKARGHINADITKPWREAGLIQSPASLTVEDPEHMRVSTHETGSQHNSR